MDLTTARAVTRTQCRKSLSVVLKQLPAGMCSSLRTTFPALAPASLRYRLQRRVLEVLRHRGLPEDTDTFTLVDNPDVRLVNAESFVVERLYWFGEKNGYEPEVLHWWRQYCRRATRILELGSNIGYFTVQGAKAAHEASYVAVEPHPGCAAVCRENIRINEITNVEVVEAAALGKVESPRVTLLMPGAMSHDHYVQAPCTGFVGRNELHRDDTEDPSYDSFSVRAVAFADLLQGVDLLKMDVEGQEFSLLSSAAESLVKGRPTMFLELLDDTPRLRSFIAELCADTDYNCFVPTADQLVPISCRDIALVSLPSSFGTRDLIVTCDVVPEWSRSADRVTIST